MQRRERAPELHRVADEPPTGEHDRRHQQQDRTDGTDLPGEAHHDKGKQQQREDPHGLLGEHGERDRQACSESKPRGEQIALHHDDAGEDEQRTGEPCQVVVVDRPGEVLRLGKERHHRRGPDRQSGPEREETAPHSVDGEDREHAEHHRHQPDEARVVPAELGDNRSQQVVQRWLLALGLAGRRQPQMIGDAGHVVQVGELVRRRADRGDAGVRHGEADEDGDDGTERPSVGPSPRDRAEDAWCDHGMFWALSALTHTVSG